MINLKINRTELNKIVEGNIRTALIIAGQGLVTYIRNSMAPGTGKKYTRDGEVHFASVAGKPPAPWTGRLRDSITYQTNFGDKCAPGPTAQSGDVVGKPKPAMGGYVVTVGSNVDYALTMEKGQKIKKVASRPYLYPALMGNRAMIRKAFERV